MLPPPLTRCAQPLQPSRSLLDNVHLHQPSLQHLEEGCRGSSAKPCTIPQEFELNRGFAIDTLLQATPPLNSGSIRGLER